MAAAVMARGCGCGNANCRSSPTNSALISWSATCRPAPASGTKSSTASSPLAMQTRRIAAAIAGFREAARLQPGHSSAKKNLAEAVALKERLDDEAAWQRRVAEKNPGDAEARYNAGVAAERAGDFQAAG